MQRALRASDWAGMQAQRGDSGIQYEENVMTALTADYWTGMQVGFGDSDTEDEEDVQRALQQVTV